MEFLDDSEEMKEEMARSFEMQIGQQNAELMHGVSCLSQEMKWLAACNSVRHTQVLPGHLCTCVVVRVVGSWWHLRGPRDHRDKTGSFLKASASAGMGCAQGPD